MKRLFEILVNELKSGNDITMVSVTASSGSTPRGAGARMIVSKEGRLYGTIGGGPVEYLCQQKAAEVLDTKKSFNESYMLRKNEVQDLGMICGGDVACYFQYISCQDKEIQKTIEYALDLFEQGKDIWIITDITEGKKPEMAIYGKENGALGMDLSSEIIELLPSSPFKKEIDGRTYSAEQINQSEKVYIFGGGHVAQSLVPTLARVGFRCVVVEDREEFAKRELFEGIFDTRLVDMNNLDELCQEITENDYVCVMTRGHANDYEVEKCVLRTPAKYIGAIGSKKKIAGINQRLRDDGFTDDDIARLTTPIGLAILAETPAEIAVSIAAQMIYERANNK